MTRSISPDLQVETYEVPLDFLLTSTERWDIAERIERAFDEYDRRLEEFVEWFSLQAEVLA